MAPRPLRLERVSNFARPKLSNFARSKSLTLNFGQHAFLQMLNDDGMIHLLFAMLSSNVKVSLSNKICQKHLTGIIEMQLSKVSTPRLKDALSYVLAHINRADSLSEDREFMNLIQPFART